MKQRKLSKTMAKTLVRISETPQPIRIECQCKRLPDNIARPRSFCPIHSAKRTVDALIRRGLLERTVEPLPQLTMHRALELPVTDGATHLRLTELGQRTAALARLGRRP